MAQIALVVLLIVAGPAWATPTEYEFRGTVTGVYGPGQLSPSIPVGSTFGGHLLYDADYDAFRETFTGQSYHYLAQGGPGTPAILGFTVRGHTVAPTERLNFQMYPEGWINMGGGWGEGRPDGLSVSAFLKPNGTAAGLWQLPSSLDDYRMERFQLYDYGDRGGFYGDITYFGPVVSPAAEPVPEPATLLLLASGLAGAGGLTWRRHRPR